MDIITWLIVGLIAGVLAATVVGGTAYGLIGDIVVGIAGAFIGGWVFREAGWHSPLAGLPGVVLVAFVGAVILLAALRLVRGGSARGSTR